MKFSALAACILAAQTLSAAIKEPVRLDAGLITGVAGANPEVRVFKGIPFAAPPVGDLRWHAPLPPTPWEDVRAADKFSPMPMQPPYAPGSFYQMEFFRWPQPPASEDCLYLNVWTAAKSEKERRPVMVWIYGGGMVQGHGAEPCFDGEAFARKGVILVTFNYRVGIFGLFAHPELSAESEQHISGNYAELDQIAALQWVQRNIAAFGGDPDNVTVFGQSAGGASINRLLVSPLAKGLFQKVIIESAAVLNSRDSKAGLVEMERRGVAFAETNSIHSLKELRAMPATNVLAATVKIRFDPNVDGRVLPELAVNIFARGGQYPVPMLIGSTSDEGQLTPIKAETFREFVQTNYGAQAEAFLKLYPTGSDDEAAQSKHDARRDESAAGERAEARAQMKLGQPAYLYYFDRKPPGHDRARYGAFHAAEIEYVFNTLNVTDRPWEATDRQLADLLISYWTNFAATGNPNGHGLPEWPAYDPKTDLSMELGDKVGTRTNDQARLDFQEQFLNQAAR
jgi:para-nitrobenzyl esterase